MTIKVLFVCLGNICRSPMAEAIFRQMAEEAGLGDRFLVDSAGIGGWHEGEPPHRGTQIALRKHGVPGEGLRARQITLQDLHEFNYLVAMDEDNVHDLRALARRAGSASAAILRLLDFADPSVTHGERDVPDPYYTGNFDHVYRLIRAGCEGLLTHLVEQHGLARKA